MAITTCNLPTVDKRTIVRGLLQRYDDQCSDAEEVAKALEVDFVEFYVGEYKYILTRVELIEVIERRKADIEKQLIAMGINLKAQDEMPSASPVLDAAVRGMGGGVTDSVTKLPNPVDPLAPV